MKKLYDFLWIAVCSCVGVFIGSSAYTFWDYRAHPGLYAMQSAPWYLSIQTRAVFTAAADVASKAGKGAAAVVVLLLLRWLVRQRIDKG